MKMKKSIDKTVPVIYCYTETSITDGKPVNEGWCKIGYTTQDAKTRIHQQTHTAGINPRIEWVVPAVYDGCWEKFDDHDFHVFLVGKNIHNHAGTELFYIEPIEAKKLLGEFKRTKINTGLNNYDYFYEQKSVFNSVDNNDHLITKYYTTNEVAALCGVSITKVRKEIREGYLNAQKIGNKYMISEDSVNEYIEQKKRMARANVWSLIIAAIICYIVFKFVIGG